jgi:uncharacterized DUF497 family protein
MSDIPSKLGIAPWAFRIVFGTTQVDFDPNKEAANVEKHGYSLSTALEILERDMLPLGNSMPFATTESYWHNSEARHNHLAVAPSGQVVQFVTTMRDPETVRVISLRPASRKERAMLEAHTGYRQHEG